MQKSNNQTLLLLEKTLRIIRSKSNFIEKDELNKNRVLLSTDTGGIVKAFLILNTSGCSWAKNNGGCNMCGFYTTSFPGAKQKDIKYQFYQAYEKLIKNKKISYLYIFTCGSFLDNNEINYQLRLEIVSKLVKIQNLKFIGIESRPEYISLSKLKSIKKIIGDKTLSVSIGLESTSKNILRYCVHKGYTLEDFKKSIYILKKLNFYTAVDLLLKPPFLTEKEAIEDAIKSIKTCKKLGVDQIYLSACFILKDTLVWYLWKNGLYLPPWRWSLLEVAKRINPRGSKVDFGGFSAVPSPVKITSNCGKCDKTIENILNIYPSNPKILKESIIKCDCYKKWRNELRRQDARSLNRRLKRALNIIKDKI